MLFLDCPIIDVSAAELGVRWNGPLPELLAERHLLGSNGYLQLGVIGASHVVSVYNPSLVFREEISCTARQLGGALPREVNQGNYRLRTLIHSSSRAEFIERASAIAALSTHNPEALVVHFPGEGPHHITALTGTETPIGWEWTTHHLYPAEKSIVTTWSSYKI